MTDNPTMGQELAAKMAAAGLTTIETAELTRLRKIEADAKAAGLLDDKGEVRKVLGTLPLTADGYVIGTNADLYSWWVPQYPGDKGICQHSSASPLVSALHQCYSTRAAAEAASKARAPEGCVINHIWSGVCSRGTRCCNVDHAEARDGGGAKEVSGD